jgi:HSP20 family protein
MSGFAKLDDAPRKLGGAAPCECDAGPSRVGGGDDLTDSAFTRGLDNFFDDDRPKFCPPQKAWNPPTDVFETRTEIVVKMEVAGIGPDDIEVTASEHYLIIRGHRHDAGHGKPEAFHLMEIQYGSFEKMIALPQSSRFGPARASLENGFLFVTVPKEGAPKPVRVEIL